MFGYHPDRPEASGYDAPQYGYGHQQPHPNHSWMRFGIEPTSPLPPNEQSHSFNSLNNQPFNTNAGGMDWMSGTADHRMGFQQHASHNHHVVSAVADLGDLMEFDEDPSPVQAGTGVRNMVSQFDNKDYVPPLPPRPIEHATPSTIGTTPSTSSYFGSLNASSSIDRMSSPMVSPGCDNGFNIFPEQSQVASPLAISPDSLPFENFQESGRMPSPLVDVSPSAPFGSLDSFMSGHDQSHHQSHAQQPHTPIHAHQTSQFLHPGRFPQTQHHIVSPGLHRQQPQPQPSQHAFHSSNFQNHQPQQQFHFQPRRQQLQRSTTNPLPGYPMMDSSIPSTPMVATPMAPSPAPSVTTTTTPGFAIWRPPVPTTPKPNMNISGQASNPGGYFRPPVPTTPKPTIGSQFILEFNPGSKPKPKAPLKSPHPRAPASIPLPSFNASIAEGLKQEPMTPQPFDVTATAPALVKSESQQTSLALRAQTSTRPSREQVPAEAWEQFRDIIKILYLEERKSLKEVMAIMAEKHGFQATPKMYKTRFSQWGFVKNNTEDEVKRLLSMKFQRDAEGKVTEFVRNGKVVNLGTYLKRKNKTEYDLVDFELNADLPSHVRCRTPTPPPATGYLRTPDLLRAQELVVGNMRKAFLHCRQVEVETSAQVVWPVTMVWGARSSELLVEANFFFEAQDVDQGGISLMGAFNQLEHDLKTLSPQGILEVLLGMVNRDPGMMTALCKYLAAYATTNLDRSHSLRQIFTCLYEVQQKHGSATVSELLWGSVTTVAEELEAIYGRLHPYVARTWVDLAVFYDHVNTERCEKLATDLRPVQKQLEQKLGPHDAEVIALRYAIVQLLYMADSKSSATKQAVNDLWLTLKKMKVVHAVKDSRPGVYCVHCPVKVDPWSKRCRRRYDSIVAIMEDILSVKIQPYFDEDFHTTEHALEARDSWTAAMNYQMPSTWYHI